MSQLFSIHPDNPQARLIRQAASILKSGGILIYPTDSGYAIGCQLDNKEALERIRHIRQLDNDHYMTLMCRDLSDIGTYAQVSNSVFRLLKAFTPGPYTFLLKASSEIPKRMLHPKRRTIGLRVPEHPIALALLEELNEPMMSTTMNLPGVEVPLSEPDAIHDLVGKQVDLIIDAGTCSHEPTTVIDMSENEIKVVRVGKGDPSPFTFD